MNKKERFVITTSPKHMDTLMAAKRKGRGELNKLLANEQLFDARSAKKIGNKYHPAIGRWTLKRVISGEFVGYDSPMDALQMANRMGNKYIELHEMALQQRRYMENVSEQDKRAYPCPECGNSIECRLPHKDDEVWDTMVICHFCGNVHFRTITRKGYDIREIPEFVEDE